MQSNANVRGSIISEAGYLVQRQKGIEFKNLGQLIFTEYDKTHIANQFLKTFKYLKTKLILYINAQLLRQLLKILFVTPQSRLQNTWVAINIATC